MPRLPFALLLPLVALGVWAAFVVGARVRGGPDRVLPERLASAAVQRFEDFEHGFALKEGLADQHFGGHHREREQIAAPIDLIAARLLGRDVADFSLELAGDGVTRRVAAVVDAEVGNLHLPDLADEHVVRSDISVHEVERAAPRIASRMQEREPAQNFSQNEQHGPEVDGAMSFEQSVDEIAAREPVHELERHEQASIDLSKIENFDNVRVRQAGLDARFLAEHLLEPGIGSQGGEDPLDGDAPREPVSTLLSRFEDLGHAPGSNEPLELVLPEGFRSPGVILRHCLKT
jgi:hypothetical protein